MKTNPRKITYLLTGIIVLLCLTSLLFLFLYPPMTQDNYTAYIYVNGNLYQTIPLSTVTSDYQFTITTEDGGYNTILVQHGAISITEADCPDKVCVKQGIIQNNLLPITCLPHGLIIELKTSNTPDVITY